MTEVLRRVISELETVSDEEQNRIATLIQAELDSAWDETLESPRSVAMLDEMARHVREIRRAGQTREFPA